MMKKSIAFGLAACLLCGCGSAETSDASASSEATAETSQSCRVIDYYDYTKPAPLSAAADDSYFADSFFAGDSRMGSLALYSDLGDRGAEIYYIESLRLYMIDTTQLQTDSGTTTIFQLMMNTSRSNIYLLLGINEIRNDDFSDWGSFYETEVIEPLLAKNPNAHVYLMLSYYPRGLSDISDEDLKANIDTINGYMKDIAKKHHLYFIDIDDSMKDENGMVKEEYLWDGLHFNVEGAQAYANYISTHTVRKEDYVKEVCE